MTETNVSWTHTKGAPHTPSMLLIGQSLYMVSDRDPEAARRELTTATKDAKGFLTSVEGSAFSASIRPFAG